MLLKKSFVPGLFTVMNLFCGYLAIIQTTNGKYWMASWLIVLAAIFDALDGKVARKLSNSSAFGVELDSLADVLSFGLAPSLLIYKAFSNEWVVTGALIAFMPLLFGALRLARFNTQVEAQSKAFIGLPIPATAVTLSAYVLFHLEIPQDISAAKFVVPIVVSLSLLMVSRVRFDKFPLLSFRRGKLNTLNIVLLGLGAVSILIFQGLIFFPMALSYILFKVLFWLVRHGKESEKNIAETTLHD